MPATSKLLNMNDGARLWARLTGVPRPHRATLIRWATRGVKGVRLRAERFAGRWYVTPEAVEDFHRATLLTPDGFSGQAGPARAAQVQRSLDDLDRKIAPRQPGRRPHAK